MTKDFIVPQVVRSWVEEIHNPNVPVWSRENYCLRLEELSKLIQQEIVRFNKERDGKGQKKSKR
jgi:hypothetical protein